MVQNGDLLRELVSNVDNFRSKILKKRIKNETFELWLDPILLSNLSGNVGTFFVRTILSKLDIDEHHLFKWRLENKYWQYQILNYYVPNCMAETISLSQVLSDHNGAEKVGSLCENGFFIKATLGDGSGRENCFDRTNEMNDIIHSHQNDTESLQKWILQKRLNFVSEFRIHTLNRDMIHGLTFIMEGRDYSNSIDAELFVKEVLGKLPDLLVQDTLIGWDIGITDTHEYYVIEANVTGFHPEFNRGFQTSGYFGDLIYGAIICAWLNNYVRSIYLVSIESVEKSLFPSDSFYMEFLFYSSIFTKEHLQILSRKIKNTNISAIVYFGEDIDDLLIKLVTYLHMADYAKICYLIVSEKCFSAAEILFTEKNFVKLIAERTLFTSDEYQIIKGISYKRKRKKCFQRVTGIIKEGPYFLI